MYYKGKIGKQKNKKRKGQVNAEAALIIQKLINGLTLLISCQLIDTPESNSEVRTPWESKTDDCHANGGF